MSEGEGGNCGVVLGSSEVDGQEEVTLGLGVSICKSTFAQIIDFRLCKLRNYKTFSVFTFQNSFIFCFLAQIKIIKNIYTSSISTQFC